MPAKALTVRITPTAHRVLKQLASDAGESMPVVLDQAIEAYRRQKFLEGLANDFAALRDDPEEWQDELDERREWEATLADGLETP